MHFPLSPHILYVDDDQDSCETVSLMLMLANSRYRISTAASAQKMLSLIKTKAFDLFIFDYALPDVTGIELCRQIRRTDLKTPIMFYSGMAAESDRQEALLAGADVYLVKPNDLGKLEQTVASLLTGGIAANLPAVRRKPVVLNPVPLRIPLILPRDHNSKSRQKNYED